MYKLPWLSSLFLVPGLVAQGIVAPAHFANAEAGASSTHGIGTRTAPSVYLGIYEDMQGVAASISGVSFRRDGGVSSKTTYLPATMVVDIWVSTAATTAGSPDPTFADNHGPDKTKVASSALAQCPAVPPSGAASPFDYRFPFSAPYAWNGAGPLCVEIRILARTNTQSYHLDWIQKASDNNPTIFRREFGTSCKASGQAVNMRLSGLASSNWPGNSGTLIYSASVMPPNTLVSTLIGSDNQSLGGLPLPFELPGTSLGSSGPCFLQSNVVITLPGVTDATGRMTLNVGFAPSPLFNGLSLFGSVAALDFNANSLGVITTNGVEHHLLAPYASSRVGSVYNTGALGPTGTVQPGAGYVVRFDS